MFDGAMVHVMENTEKKEKWRMGNFELNEKIRNTLEENDWNVLDVSERDGKFYAEIEFYSDLGEDFIETIIYDGTPEGFVKSFTETLWNYDAEDHAAEWIERRGENGVPDSIQALLDDAYSIGETMNNLDYALMQLDFEDLDEE